MKIYTRSGDSGQTSLFAGGRVSKSHVRLHAYGTVDELNAILGLAIAAGLDEALRAQVLRVQAELFTVGADLATPIDAQSKRIMRVTPDLVERLEAEIDAWQEHLPPLKNFILPGGGMGGAFLHQARTVCRRAERWIVAAKENDQLNDQVLRYINRLSDWLFVAARVANRADETEEELWHG